MLVTAIAGERPVASCSKPTQPFQPCPRLVKGSSPRPRAGDAARRIHTGPVRVPPCNVTNTGEEMRDPKLYDFDPEIIETSQYQIPHPERGPLERQIELTYEEALFEEEGFDQEHTNYWFTEPQGGWNQEPKRLRKATVVPNVDAKAHHPGEGRIHFWDLKEGQEHVGTIFRMMLYHGVQVDIGAEYDVLIPMPEHIWAQQEMKDTMKLDAELSIRIHKMVPSPICRFPIIAELLSPVLPNQQQTLQRHLAGYEPVFNLSGQSDMAQAMALTGRKYKPISYLLDTTPDTKTRKLQAMQEDEEEEPKEIYEVLPPSLLTQIRDMAAAM